MQVYARQKIKDLELQNIILYRANAQVIRVVAPGGMLILFNHMQILERLHVILSIPPKKSGRCVIVITCIRASVSVPR